MQQTTKMTPTERRAVVSLSSIMGFRMMGLFMVLPLFSLYASQLAGATPTKVGIAIGIYGLFQALFQIPFGSLSDRFGRKPIIFMGLIIFAIGSLVAGTAHSILLMIIGRAMQGMGAVGSTILALMADLTREEQRTKAMAISGITIGFSFSAAMFVGPVLAQWLAVNNLFFIATLLGFVGIFILYTYVPYPVTANQGPRTAGPEWKSLFALLTTPELARLNMGIFLLHAIFTASFVVIPIDLQQVEGLGISQQWKIYLPALLTAFFLSLMCIGIAERKQQLKPYFLSGISVIAIAELLLWKTSGHLAWATVSICLFFTGFSLLEAFLPSLISRTAPAARKGSALGIYSCSQFSGIFAGGVLGGWLYGQFHFSGVYLFCIFLTLFWLSLAFLMQPPRYLITQTWHLSPSKQRDFANLAIALQALPGMVEVTLMTQEGIGYLKMERRTLQDPDFIRLREQLQLEQ